MDFEVANYKGVFDSRLGFGRRPAVLVIDFVNAYTEPGSPLFAPAVVAAANQARELLAAARSRHVPVIYTKVLYQEHGRDGGLFVKKIPVLRQMVAGNPMAEIVQGLSPEPQDIVVTKQYASAFFGTSLASTLTSLGVDTLVIAGCSTSGCVRATAVDGMQHGLRVVVVRECVADRDERPHQANLFDINAKYGDVVSLGEVVERLQSLAMEGY